MRDTSIFLSSPDYRRLSGLVAALKAKRRFSEPHLLRLEKELGLAQVFDPEDMPGDVVSIGSTARIRNLDTGELRLVSLVFPAELDGGSERISIFAPLGTALIGERAGSTVVCTAPGGSYSFMVEEILSREAN